MSFGWVIPLLTDPAPALRHGNFESRTFAGLDIPVAGKTEDRQDLGGQAEPKSCILKISAVNYPLFIPARTPNEW